MTSQRPSSETVGAEAPLLVVLALVDQAIGRLRRPEPVVVQLLEVVHVAELVGPGAS